MTYHTLLNRPPRQTMVFVHDVVYSVVNYSSRVDVVCVYVPLIWDFHDGITFEWIELES